MKPKKILIIDDNLLDIANISQILLRGGYRTRHATDQVLALRAIDEVSPDLIICKLNFKRLNAQKLVQKVRRSHRLRSIPFLFLVESPPAEAAPEILGPKRHLTKPFSREQLLIAVQDHLKRKPTAPDSRENADGARISLGYWAPRKHTRHRVHET